MCAQTESQTKLGPLYKTERMVSGSGSERKATSRHTALIEQNLPRSFCGWLIDTGRPARTPSKKASTRSFTVLRYAAFAIGAPKLHQLGSHHAALVVVGPLVAMAVEEAVV